MSRFVAASSLSVLAGAALAAPEPVDPSAIDPPAVVRQFDLLGPAVIVFLPASRRDAGEAQVPSETAYATQALGRVKWCLGARAATYHLVYADRLVLRDGDHEETFEISDSAPLPGAVLFKPDTSSHIMFAGGGAQSLVPLLSIAAGEYFGTNCHA
jgi:hypothetical protein